MNGENGNGKVKLATVETNVEWLTKEFERLHTRLDRIDERMSFLWAKVCGVSAAVSVLIAIVVGRLV